MSKRKWENPWTRASVTYGETDAGTKPKRRWESDSAAKERLKNASLDRMSSDMDNIRREWSRETPGCEDCGGRFFVLKEGSFWANGGFPYMDQCNVCLSKMNPWGKETTFSNQEDAFVCTLLNRQGVPMNREGMPSPMHFYRSALLFYHHFKRKDWHALVGHVRADFTTTWSAPLSGVQYRGWYNTRTRVYPGSAVLDNVAI